MEYEHKGLWRSLLGYLLRPPQVMYIEDVLGLKRQPTLQYLYIGP